MGEEPARRARPNPLHQCNRVLPSGPFSSGPHGGANVEPPTIALRKRYMPLFNANHVRVVFSGHEHLFEHWVEHYTDATGPHRMDLVVSGGGGAPIYAYKGEPIFGTI